MEAETRQVPREYEHLTTLYNLLQEQAVDGVFTGSLTAVAKSMNVSHVYHTRLPATLERLGCIERKSKGAGVRPGQIVLIAPPTLDDFLYIYKRVHLTPTAKLDTMRASLKAMERRMGNIDLPRWIASVEAQLVDMRQRLDALEAHNTEGGNDLASTSQDT